MSIHLFTYITAAISAILISVLIFLLLHQKPRKKANIFLAGWFLFFTFFVQIMGSLIMATPNPETALFLYQLGGSFAGFIGFFYLFVREYLGIKKEKKLFYLALFSTVIIFFSFFIKRNLFFSGVRWDKEVQFYLFEVNYISLLLFLPVFFLWFYGIYLLFRAFRKSRSPIERNRLKYLILGALLPYIGGILIIVPFVPLRRYPFDMFGVTLSTICLTYGVIRYRLLDITVILRKGLLYSVLTATVTGTYLSFSLLLQRIFQRPEAPPSFPAVASTALFVALIFQPLQTITQRILDKVFFRKKYDPQKLVADLSQTFSETLDLNLLSEKLINILSKTLQISKATLLLLKEDTNTLKVQNQKNLPRKAKDIEIALDSSLAKHLSQSDQVQLKDNLKEKNILTKELQQYDLELFVPLRSREKLKGLLLLGPKLSEQLYSLQELELFKVIADSATLTLDKASFFDQLTREKEKVETARATLEVKVQARTKELKELADSLDEQVKQRTKELQERVKELERFYKLTVGRELKMIELKKEIKQMKKQG